MAYELGLRKNAEGGPAITISIDESGQTFGGWRGMTTPTWVVAQAKMSVSVNGAFIPFENVPDTLQRFVRPALFSTEDERWELRTVGTAFFCRYRNLSLAMTTSHQTGDGGDKPLPEKFVVLASGEDRTLAVPPVTISWPIFGEDKDHSLQDLYLFDFEERVQKHRVDTINLGSIRWSDDPGLAVDYSFLIGYPSASFDADLDDEGACKHFLSKWIRQDLQPDGHMLLDVENRNIFIKHECSTRRSISPDGLSGSPVFSLVRDEASDRYLRFDGIVTDARDDRFAVYPSSFIRRLMDQIVGDKVACGETKEGSP